MTLDEAIEILNDILYYVEPIDPPEEHDAIKLGSEALEARKVWQDNEGFDPAEALPSETPPITKAKSLGYDPDI